MSKYSTPNFGRALELVAHDEKFGIYTDPRDCRFLTTIRLDKRRLTKKDRREVDEQVKLLLAQTDGRA